MASLKKYTLQALPYHLRHNAREYGEIGKAPSNREIDPARTPGNYYLSPMEHGRSSDACRRFVHDRLDEVYHYRRADLKVAAEWVVTAPADLSPEQEALFFAETYAYLTSLYGEQNCIQAIVHVDEGVQDQDGVIIYGHHHLHYLFLPIVRNSKYMQTNSKGNLTKIAQFPEKICADELLTKAHLKMWHPRFQKWLDEHGVPCCVYSGVTAGSSKTVKQLKAETYIRQLEIENRSLQDRIHELEIQLSKTKENTASWGSSSGWGKEVKSWEIEF